MGNSCDNMRKHFNLRITCSPKILSCATTFVFKMLLICICAWPLLPGGIIKFSCSTFLRNKKFFICHYRTIRLDLIKIIALYRNFLIRYRSTICLRGILSSNLELHQSEILEYWDAYTKTIITFEDDDPWEFL